MSNKNRGIIVVRENTWEFLDIARAIIEEEMGWTHSYYAIESVKRGFSKIVVAFIDNAPVGVGVYYLVNGSSIRVCVHYYIVVREEYRGIGVGKVLVSSIEELNRSVRGFLATTVYDNMASRRLFGSLGYSEYTFNYIEERLGYSVLRELVRATCGFEDDIFLVKSIGLDPLELLKSLSKERKIIRSLWENICWQPWLDLRRSSISRL